VGGRGFPISQFLAVTKSKIFDTELGVNFITIYYILTLGNPLDNNI
jgi:hypothetical protein